MAFTSPKLGLRVWNLLTDLYDHTQLADNWAKVDYHDHSPGKGVQIPTEGLADGSVTALKLAADTNPAGLYDYYHNLYFGGGTVAPVGSTVYGMLGANSVLAVGAAGSSVVAFHIEPSDFTALGRTPKMRLVTSLITNAVAPATTINSTLYPITAFGGTSGNAPTVATVGSSISGMAFVTQAASSGAYGTSFDFDVPASSWYMLGINANATVAAGSFVWVQSALQVHWV
jgi:hypothetical protein